MAIKRLNHAVYYVRDARVAERFYCDVLGFGVVVGDPAGRFSFLRAEASDNHHDVALFTIGSTATANPAGRGGAVGLYHLAWEVETIAELETFRRRLSEVGALVGASDHGVSKSLYAVDPDGNEFEIMWAVPPALWGDLEHDMVIEPLDLAREIARWSEIHPG